MVFYQGNGNSKDGEEMKEERDNDHCNVHICDDLPTFTS